jgi:hypothetical protein
MLTQSSVSYSADLGKENMFADPGDTLEGGVDLALPLRSSPCETRKR